VNYGQVNDCWRSGDTVDLQCDGIVVVVVSEHYGEV
jgi:hypothetical protein